MIKVYDDISNLDYEVDSQLLSLFGIEEIHIKNQKLHVQFNVNYKAYLLAEESMKKKSIMDIKGTDVFLFKRQRDALDSVLLECVQKVEQVTLENLLEDI